MIPVPSSSLGPVGPASMGVCGLSSVPSHRSPVKCAARGGRRKSPPLAGGCSTAQPSFARAVGGLPHRAAMGRAAAFTLIELLVVISIIAILAALAFPAVNGAIGSARKAQARNDVMQIVTAIKAFKAEYGRLPIPAEDFRTPSGDGKENNDDPWYQNNNNVILRALLAEESGSGGVLNPKKIVFLDAKTTKTKKGGVDLSDYIFYDPWGTPYAIKVDRDGSGKLEYYNNGTANIFGIAMAASAGPGKSFGNPVASDPSGKDDILSFK